MLVQNWNVIKPSVILINHRGSGNLKKIGDNKLIDLLFDYLNLSRKPFKNLFEIQTSWENKIFLTINDYPINGSFNKRNSFKKINSIQENFISSLLFKGLQNPKIEISKKEINLKIANTSKSNTFNLMFDDQRKFKVISENEIELENSILTERYTIYPNESVEFILDFTNEKKGKLINLISEIAEHKIGALGSFDVINDSFINFCKFEIS